MLFAVLFPSPSVEFSIFAPLISISEILLLFSECSFYRAPCSFFSYLRTLTAEVLVHDFLLLPPLSWLPGLSLVVAAVISWARDDLSVFYFFTAGSKPTSAKFKSSHIRLL